MTEPLDALLDALTQGGLATARQLALLGLPLLGLALALRAVETALITRLQLRLGRRAVLGTAWIGVPVHELSHALACVLFAHRVERVRLFAPDRRTNTLGSVQHTWNPHNPWAQVGRFVIGVAPLLGGSFALWALGASLGDPLVAPVELSGVNDWRGALDVLVEQARGLADGLLQADTWTRPRTWLFLYLCLCVGAHLAPSGADMAGARVGALVLLLFWLLANTIAVLAGADVAPLESGALSVLAPLAVIQGLALALSTTALGVTWLLTAALPERG